MKIKFLKPFRLYNPVGDDVMMGEGAVENMKEDYAEWLIDNGFAEEVKESGWWKPKRGETYWCLNSDGDACQDRWLNYKQDRTRTTIGNVFKTKEAAERYRDYLEAVTTVRQDEGVMTPEGVIHAADAGIIIGRIIVRDRAGNLEASIYNFSSAYPCVDTIYFDTCEHAQASLDKHPDEWKIIANYDWSRE